MGGWMGGRSVGIRLVTLKALHGGELLLFLMSSLGCVTTEWMVLEVVSSPSLEAMKEI